MALLLCRPVHCCVAAVAQHSLHRTIATVFGGSVACTKLAQRDFSCVLVAAFQRLHHRNVYWQVSNWRGAHFLAYLARHAIVLHVHIFLSSSSPSFLPFPFPFFFFPLAAAAAASASCFSAHHLQTTPKKKKHNSINSKPTHVADGCGRCALTRNNL